MQTAEQTTVVRDLVIAAFKRQTDSEPSEETLAEYDRTFKALDFEEWRTPKEAGVDFHYCESLYADGVLERRQVPLLRGLHPVGERIYFRHNHNLFT